MARFKFRLQSVLDHTGRQKQRAAADFAAAALELETRQNVLARHQTMFAGLEQAAPAPEQALGVTKLRERQACRDRITRKIYGVLHLVQEQTRITGKTRQKLVASQQEEKKYLLLKERHRDHWQTATRRKEQRELDEVAGRRASFQKQSHRA
jgi:flagellar export protein FliJ